MRTIFVIIFLSAVFISQAQINPTKDTNKYSDPQNMDVVYTSEAKCTMGEDQMYKTIYSGITYSEEAKKANIKDEVLISFDVNFDNKLQDFTIVHGVGYGIDEQIIAVIKTLKFEAAVMNGIKVRQNVMLTIPIRTYPEM
ncbi:MAG: energy transducer TonB [Bacteroidales bacterium]